MKRILAIIFLFTAVKAQAQYPRVHIPGSELRKISSSIVAGQEYELHILLPGGYNQTGKKYPVVYVMDSQWDFPLVKSIYGQQYYDGFIPELIIVGVTWGGVAPNADSLRVRDYTPTNDGRQKQGGSADKFLSFLRNELFPFMESNYRVDGTNRSIMGCSLGGLITLYALFSQPDMFSGYAAASPAIGWDRDVIYQYEKKYFESQSSSPARLYITMGEVERGVPGFEKFARLLEARNYPSLHTRPKVLENTGHSGTKSETYSRGLQYIFERKKLTLPGDILNWYTGTYELPGGARVELKKEGAQLFGYFSPANKTELFANTEAHLYATHEFFNLYFKISGGKVEGFTWVRYGGGQFVKKIN